MQHRSEIDGLRALAVSSVVVFHFFPKVLPYGYLGVDIFFVISGYLITAHLLNLSTIGKLSSLRLFYTRRAKRLFPALFTLLLLTSIVVSVIFLKTDLERFTPSLVASYTFWANFFFWRDGGYFGSSDQLKPLLHIWSLSVEEQFYLLYPSFLLIGLAVGRWVKLEILVFVGLATLSSFLLWIYLYKIGGATPAFFLLPTRAWQFGLGAALSILAMRRNPFSISTKLNDFGLYFSILLLLVALLGDIGSQTQTVLVSCGTAGFLAFSTGQMNWPLTAFRARPARFLGEISYSLYLYHWPVAVLLTYYFVDTVPTVASFLGVLLSGLLGFLSYKMIENRFRRELDLKFTLVLMAFCVFASLLSLKVADTIRERVTADQIAEASGTHYRCSLDSYRPFGASRACDLYDADTSESKVVLLGNSHAQMFGPLVASAMIGTKRDLILVPLNACLPTTTVNISEKCMVMAQRNLEAVLDDDGVSLVLIAMTWYSEEYIDNTGNVVGSSALETGVVHLIADIRESGKDVALFSPIAIPNRDLASSLSRLLRFGRLDASLLGEKLTVTRSVYDDRFSALNLYFEKELGDHYIRVFEDLCDSQSCYFGRSDYLYFSDASHLSQTHLRELRSSELQLRQVLAK